MEESSLWYKLFGYSFCKGKPTTPKKPEKPHSPFLTADSQSSWDLRLSCPSTSALKRLYRLRKCGSQDKLKWSNPNNNNNNNNWNDNDNDSDDDKDQDHGGINDNHREAELYKYYILMHIVGR